VLTSPSLADPPDTHRIVVSIGSNLGHKNDKQLRYAESEAQDMLNTLQHLGGFKSEWSYLLLGKTAEQVNTTFAEIKERIQEIGPQGKVLLLVYYSGHADSLGLHLGETTLAIDYLRQFVTKSGAALSIAIVDACYSGSLARAKGVKRGPTYDIKTLTEPQASNMQGHVIITSSGPEELSQEVDSVKGSVFSHYILSGLRGAADLSRDQQVTLSELYHYAYQRTLEKTSTSTVGPQHAVREIKLLGTGELVLTNITKGHAAIMFPAGLQGTYYIVRKRGQEIMAEVELNNKPVKIALPTDTYIIRRRTKDTLLVSQMNLSWGGEHPFEPAKQIAYPLDDSTARGTNPDPSPHRLSLAFELRDGAVAGADLISGATLSYGLRLEKWQLGITGFWGSGSFDAQDTDIRNHEYEAALFAGYYLWSTKRWNLAVGLAAGLRYVFQDVRNGPEHGALGGVFQTYAKLGFILRDPFFAFADLGVGLLLSEKEDNKTLTRPLIRGSLGLGWQF
jgi:hypothetical protein